MKNNRSKGRELYKALMYAPSTNKSQTTSVTSTPSISTEAQTPKQTDTANAATIKEDETISTSTVNVVTGHKTATHPFGPATPIIQETHKTEQNLAAEVHSRKVASRQRHILSAHSHFY